VLLSATAGSAALITNGDFEDTTGWNIGDAGTDGFPPGWSTDQGRKNAADPQSGADAIGGSGTSAYMPAGDGVPQREIEQSFDKTGPHWRFEMDFAAADPGGSGSSYRTISGALNQKGSGSDLNIFFIATRSTPGDTDGKGDLMMYDGSAYQDILEDAVIWDADVTTSPLTHHLTIEGQFDTPGGVPELTATIRDSDDTEHFADNLSAFVLENKEAATTDASDGIDFTSYNTFLSPSDSLIDNLSIVTIPEPVSVVLLGLGGLCLLRRRCA
jgi:hypothetical protein